MSKVNEYIRYAKQKGYTVKEDGTVLNPKGKALKGFVRKRKQTRKGYGSGVYSTLFISIANSNNGYENYPIPVHRFIAYLKFGEEALQDGIVTRHLNDNSLDNRWSNIEIGTAHDNHLDAVKNGKSEAKKVTS